MTAIGKDQPVHTTRERRSGPIPHTPPRTECFESERLGFGHPPELAQDAGERQSRACEATGSAEALALCDRPLVHRQGDLQLTETSLYGRDVEEHGCTHGRELGMLCKVKGGRVPEIDTRAFAAP